MLRFRYISIFCTYTDNDVYVCAGACVYLCICTTYIYIYTYIHTYIHVGAAGSCSASSASVVPARGRFGPLASDFDFLGFGVYGGTP